jgi:hypothetical protein
MKKKILFLNFTLIVAVLFSMLFQSLDSFGHFETQKAELKCHHKNASKHEITHQHHAFENCLICKFAFSNYHKPEKKGDSLIRIDIVSKKSFTYSFEFTKKFKGALFSLRGPPVV